jgi:hypothetical protein
MAIKTMEHRGALATRAGMLDVYTAKRCGRNADLEVYLMRQLRIGRLRCLSLNMSGKLSVGIVKPDGAACAVAS